MKIVKDFLTDTKDVTKVSCGVHRDVPSGQRSMCVCWSDK